jgi:type IV pilus assembly protein PilC
MTAFVWEARGRAGEVKTGVMEADDASAVEAKLKMQLLVPVSVHKQPRQFDFVLGSGVKTTDVVIFTRMFATMIDSGLPIVQCLEILSSQSENKRFGKILGQVKGSVEGGLTLSDALARHPKIFDDLFVNLVAAGEAGGILDGILERLSVYMEKAMKLKRRVKGAMVYPISIIGIAALVVTILLTKVIPVFEKMFKDFGGGQLPMPTRVVITVSHALAHYLPFIVAFLIAGSVVLRLVLRQKRGREAFDGMLLKLPVLGPVLRKVVVARFTRTMGTLLGAGVPILDALEICAKTAGNVVVQNGIMYARAQISEGKDMATPLAQTQLMPPMVVQMIGVGEQTGALDAMLSKIADFYEEEVDVAVAAMTSLIEPIMMVFLGAVIGGMVVAMYLPIFEMAGSMKTG